jgi:S1-C subfamily serine protease/lysophospholipase L1-like esterase
MTRFAALGDSITVGMGDPVPGGGWRGWAALLAGTLPRAEVHNLATSGALAADVERFQLPAAAALRPDVASVVVGINDTLRGDCDPDRTGAAIGRTVAGLREAGAQVLTMRLPDPGQMFGLPGALARPLARRMHAVNAVVDEVARRHGTLHLDITRDPATYERRYWSVDRLHPNERGHRLIACRFHALLATAGFGVGSSPDPEPSSPPPTRLAEARWMATKGTAWLVRRSRDLVPALVGLAVREWLGLEDPEPESESTVLEPVNLNALSGRSGNLELSERLPLARLKVRNRVSGRNEGTKPYHGTELRARPMSQTYDPNYPGDGQGYLAGPGYAGGPGYPGGYQGAGFGSAPPPPPRRSRKRGLVITGAVALAAGAAAGGLIGSMNKGVVSTATATSNTVLSASQIAQRVDPALVDIVSTNSAAGSTSAGTGIVLTSNGEILTNNHVIRGATSIKVTDVGNGKTYTATVVGYDASDDVAVIQLQNASGLTTASLGDSSSVASGDTVTALGNAGGKGGTPSVASGTVTALGQSITASDEGSGVSENLTGLIQTNADIQPGDSGGALVNSHGQVIGMNTAASTGFQFQGQSGSQGGQEQAYAIPIDSALTTAKQIEGGNGSSTIHIGATAFLGIETSGSDSSGSSGFGGFGGQDSGTGVTIAGALSGSPAASAGLTQGDTITSVGGQSVSSASDIQQVLVKYHPGDKISVSWQDASGQSHTSTVTLTSGPAA